MRRYILWLAQVIYNVTLGDSKGRDLMMNQAISTLNDTDQERLTHAVNRLLGTCHDNTEVTMAAYQAMKAKMKNIFEMLWPVELEIEHEGKLLCIRYIVAAQPDPKAEGWWYIRLPDWSVLRFKADGNLTAMPKLTCKTHMKKFFQLQRKLLKEQRRWSPDMDNAMAWQQVLVQSELMGDGSYVSYSHESFDAHQKGLYYLEDKRTRRADYEWGKPGDPMDKHAPGKKAKAIIEGKVPCDLGRFQINGVKFDAGTHLKNPKAESYTWYQLEQMVRWKEIPLLSVGYPVMFSVPKKLGQLFEGCYMPEDIGKKFATRLGNNPYWKVKDKKRKRWYIYSYDWRTDRRTFTHSVIPIGHIEPYRKIPGEYYFTMYSEDTLAQRRNQSLWIADYQVELTSNLCWQLGIKKDFIGCTLSVSVYNDWAAQLWRELGEPANPPAPLDDEEDPTHASPQGELSCGVTSS
jgi:hypothetical protein